MFSSALGHVPGSVGSRGVARLETELIPTHKVVPFDGLDIAVCISVGCRIRIREQECAEWVSTLICTVRVQLAAIVVGGDIDERLVDDTGDCIL